MPWAKSGIFRKFFLVMGALALVPMTILGLQLVRVSSKGIQVGRRGIQTAVLVLHKKISQKLAEQVDDFMRRTDERFVFTAEALRRENDPADRLELMRSRIRADGNIAELAIIDSSGREVLKAENAERPLKHALLKRVRADGLQEFLKTRRRTVTFARIPPIPALYLYYPLDKSSALRVLLSLRYLYDRIAAETVGRTGFAVLVGPNGDPLIFPEGRFEDPALLAFAQWPIVVDALKAITVASREFSVTSGKSWVGAYAPVSSIGAAVLILQGRDEAYAAAQQIKLTAVGAVFAIVLLSLVASIFVARRLTAPILSLTRGAEAVARGNFEVKVDVETGDELQELADTFNRMTAKLNQYSSLQVDRLIAEQRKTEAILYSIDDGIVLADKEGKVQLANRRAVELLGLGSKTSVEGRTLAETMPASRLRDAVLAMAEDPKGDAFKDLDLSTDQSRRYLRVRAHPVVTPEGPTMGVVVAVRDVTYERELDKMKEEFLQYITHDLRNPVGSMIGFLDYLLKGTAGGLNPDQHKIVSSVRHAASRLLGMINNILDIAKIESGKLKPKLKTASLKSIAAHSIEILESLAQKRKIEIELRAGGEFAADMDPDLIERVFNNLVGNAIKYAPEGSTVNVSLTDEGKDFKACVEDSGEGIPEEYTERIFQKFEQVSGQRQGGTGLGLTIAKFFVESHLGRIWVESEPGKGARFYFTLPKKLRPDDDGGAVAG